jgi:hypothetical protein
MIRMLFVVALTLTSVSGAIAPPCLNDTLSTYIGLRSGCEIGPVVFNDFKYTVLGASGGAVTASDILVSPVLVFGQAQLIFSSPNISVTGADFMHLWIAYNVQAPPALFQFRTSLDPTTSAIVPAGAAVFTEVCASPSALCPPGTIVNLHAFNTGISSSNDETVFPLSSHLTVLNMIEVDANGAFVSVPAFRNDVSFVASAVPEPSTYGVTTAALLGLASLSWRSKARPRR